MGMVHGDRGTEIEHWSSSYDLGLGFISKFLSFAYTWVDVSKQKKGVKNLESLRSIVTNDNKELLRFISLFVSIGLSYC